VAIGIVSAIQISVIGLPSQDGWNTPVNRFDTDSRTSDDLDAFFQQCITADWAVGRNDREIRAWSEYILSNCLYFTFLNLDGRR
jgi:hypothetical protein